MSPELRNPTPEGKQRHSVSFVAPWLWGTSSAEFRHGLVLLAFIAIDLVFFSPVLLGGRLLAPGNGLQLFLPNYYSPRTLGEPNLMTGYPVAADPEIMTWYPVSLLLSLIPHSWNAFELSAYIIAAWFAYLYVYELTANHFAGFISGLVYGL